MVDENDHGASVDAWMGKAAVGLSSGQLLELFERAFAVLWQRAHRTLGDVTLMAIADRVLYSAAEHFPVLGELRVGTQGVRWDELRAWASLPTPGELSPALRFVLVDFLTVLGNLTADILTPALHAELSKVAPEEASPRNPDSNGGESEP